MGRAYRIAHDNLAKITWPSYRGKVPASLPILRLRDFTLLWIAQTVYAQIGYGSTVYVYQ